MNDISTAGESYDTRKVLDGHRRPVRAAGRVQLDAIMRVQAEGIAIVPVWNKSHREHTIIGTKPQDVPPRPMRRLRRGGMRAGTTWMPITSI